MTSRTAVAAPPHGEHQIPSQPRASRLPTHQRRPAMIAIAVLLIAAGAFGGLQLVATSNNKISALVLVQAVPAGHVITSTDLGSVSLSGKVAYTPASAEATVVGNTAARDLFAGQLLTHSMTTAVTVPDATHALVGLQLKADQVPSAGLNDGDPVELVEQQPVRERHVAEHSDRCIELRRLRTVVLLERMVHPRWSWSQGLCTR